MEDRLFVGHQRDGRCWPHRFNHQRLEVSLVVFTILGEGTIEESESPADPQPRCRASHELGDSRLSSRSYRDLYSLYSLNTLFCLRAATADEKLNPNYAIDLTHPNSDGLRLQSSQYRGIARSPVTGSSFCHSSPTKTPFRVVITEQPSHPEQPHRHGKRCRGSTQVLPSAGELKDRDRVINPTPKQTRCCQSKKWSKATSHAPKRGPRKKGPRLDRWTKLR